MRTVTIRMTPVDAHGLISRDGDVYETFEQIDGEWYAAEDTWMLGANIPGVEVRPARFERSDTTSINVLNPHTGVTTALVDPEEIRRKLGADYLAKIPHWRDAV